MAVVGGMLASAVLKVVTQQIGSAISGQIKLHGNLSDDFRKMKMALESVEAVLKDAERRSIQDAAVRLWLKRLTDAMHAISDMFDEVEDHTKPVGRKLAAVVPNLPIGPKITMVIKMKNMRKELENITNQHHNFSFKTDNISNCQTIPDERETDSYIEDQTIIVGRTEEKRKIIVSFSTIMTQDIIILPIYGIGGIGKTTLAKLVFNDTHFKDYSQVWIYVSQIFNLNKIGNSIISQLSNKESSVTERQMIRNRLGQLLNDTNKKLMVVLDDLWEENDSQLNELKAMLRVIKSGKVVVIVTTRDERIARKICTVEPYKLLPLSDENCWAIIKRKSDFELRDDKDDLEQIGKDIAVKCGGVALAAQTLGYMLKSLTFGEWESVRNNDIWDASTLEDESSMHRNVLACLLLSYSSMLPALKLCFAYCAFFPKGHKIVKDDLIYQWIAHGFVMPSGMFSARQIGRNYAKQLLGMSFLQHSKASSVTRLHRDDVTLFSMHDLVHELARLVMVGNVLEASKSGSIGKSCRYAVLADSSSSLKQYVASPDKIRALRFLGYGGIELRGIAFSSAKYLRVLDLSECYIQELPNCIGKLKQLRYLNAQRVQCKVMPIGMTKLTKLIYLNLRGSMITTLPESIGQMKGLMHLDLSYCLKIVKLPESFVELKELVHLDLNNCRSVDVFTDLLMGLKELMYLDLSKCQCVKGTMNALGGLTKLQYLDLSRTFMGKKNLSELQKVINNLTELYYLGLSTMRSIVPDLSTAEMDTFIYQISSLPNLEHLKLSHNPMIVTLPESIGCFRKLCSLDLSSCKNLESLPETMVKMDSLKILYVDGCYNLDKSSLDQLRVLGLSNLVVHCGPDIRADLMFQDTNPDKRLKISSLEHMKSTEVAQSIETMRKQRIERLNLEWNGDGERFVEDMEVLEKLLPPITLKYFELRGYNSVCFPPWVMSINQYLPNIVGIWMCGLPNCNSLPPLGQLPNLKELHIRGMDSITRIDEEFYGGERAFPHLWEFELTCMESLEEWITIYSDEENNVNELMGPNLHRLSLCDCPDLRLKPCPPKAKHWEIVRSDNVLTSWGEVKQTCASSSDAVTSVTDVTVISSKVPMQQWRLLHHLPALSSLRIEGCSDVTCSSQQIMRGLSSIQSLHLENDGQPELPQWLGEVTNLRELDIRGYLKLHDPLESMKQLTSLRALRLFRCGGTTTPRWLGELNSLEELLISDCPELNNLRGTLQQLTSLQLLSLDSCGISSLPECLGNLSSLRRLEIVDCRDIKSLPESTKKLTKLEDLNIINCPELQQWCELKENKKKLARINERVIAFNKKKKFRRYAN